MLNHWYSTKIIWTHRRRTRHMSTPFGLQESLLCAFYTDAFSLPKINYRWSKHSISLSKKVRCIFLQKIFHSNIFVIVFKRGFNVLLCGLAEIRQSPFQPWEGSFFKLWLGLIARWHVLSKTLTTNIKKMSENLLIHIAVIIFISIFVVALGVVIIVLIVQYINDKKKKKDQLLKVIIKGINSFWPQGTLRS